MTEIDIVRCLADSEAINAGYVDGQAVLQIWYGGTTVSVYVQRANGSWVEITVWSIGDDNWEPLEREEIEKHMAMQLANWKETGRVE